MKTILVPLDGSALAERAIPYAAMCAQLLDAKIHLLRVINDIRPNVPDPSSLALGLPASEFRSQATVVGNVEEWETASHAALHYLQSQANLLQHLGIEVTIEVQSGNAADYILEVAHQFIDAMIVIATHGYSGFRRLALGSVTDKVVQHTNVPIFIVPGNNALAHDAPRLKRIMLPIDGSPLSKAVLPLACDLAKAAQAQLLLFQSVSPVTAVYSGLDLPSDIQDALHNTATKDLRTTADALRITADVKVATAVALGDAAEQIVNTASQNQVDLVLMATHGYGGLKRFALGSVADKVLKAASAPLLLVRAN
jgi:nucleotide-binding universal stress UspA family protein